VKYFTIKTGCGGERMRMGRPVREAWRARGTVGARGPDGLTALVCDVNRNGLAAHGIFFTASQAEGTGWRMLRDWCEAVKA
jgi:hypothetical protein